MENIGHSDYSLEEISVTELNEEDMQLFDETDKPFLILYLFIFIFGIYLTIVSI